MLTRSGLNIISLAMTVLVLLALFAYMAKADFIPRQDIDMKLDEIKNASNISTLCLNLSGDYKCSWPAGGSGSSFDQSLNTTDNVTFKNVTLTCLNLSGVIRCTWPTGDNTSWSETVASGLYIAKTSEPNLNVNSSIYSTNSTRAINWYGMNSTNSSQFDIVAGALHVVDSWLTNFVNILANAAVSIEAGYRSGNDTAIISAMNSNDTTLTNNLNSEITNRQGNDTNIISSFTLNDTNEKTWRTGNDTALLGNFSLNDSNEATYRSGNDSVLLSAFSLNDSNERTWRISNDSALDKIGMITSGKWCIGNDTGTGLNCTVEPVVDTTFNETYHNTSKDVTDNRTIWENRTALDMLWSGLFNYPSACPTSGGKKTVLTALDDAVTCTLLTLADISITSALNMAGYAIFNVSELNVTKINANDWTNVSITESQISDLGDYIPTSDEPNLNVNESKFLNGVGLGTITDTKYCIYNATLNNITCISEGGGTSGDAPWLNDSTQIYQADVSKTLNVSNNATFDSGTLFINSNTNKAGVGTITPYSKFSILSDGAGTSAFGIYMISSGYTLPAMSIAQGGSNNSNIIVNSALGETAVLFGGSLPIQALSGTSDGWRKREGATSAFIDSVVGNGLEVLNNSASGSEILTNGGLTTAANMNWTVAGDGSLASNKATFTYSSGSSTYITQNAVNFTATLKTNTYYAFSFNVTDSIPDPLGSGFPSMTITTNSGVLTSINCYNGTRTAYFKTNPTTNTMFRLTVTLVSGQSFSLDDLSLKETPAPLLYVDTNNNKIGIGTTSLNTTLTVNGGIMVYVGDSPVTCAANTTSNQYYDLSMNEYCYCNSTNYRQYDSSGLCT
jgi:hypothetical protein